MSGKGIENMTTVDNTFVPTWINSYPLPDVKFSGHCLINQFIPYYFRKVINLYVFYTPNPWSRNLNTDLTLNNCLFGAVKLIKNPDPDK